MNFSGKVTGLAVLMAAQMMSGAASAGAKIENDDGTKWLSVGIGARTSFSSVENGAPNGSDRSSDFNLDSARIYLNGQIHENV